jgi:hypothetical protein
MPGQKAPTEVLSGGGPCGPVHAGRMAGLTAVPHGGFVPIPRNL